MKRILVYVCCLFLFSAVIIHSTAANDSILPAGISIQRSELADTRFHFSQITATDDGSFAVLCIYDNFLEERRTFLGQPLFEVALDSSEEQTKECLFIDIYKPDGNYSFSLTVLGESIPLTPACIELSRETLYIYLPQSVISYNTLNGDTQWFYMASCSNDEAGQIRAHTASLQSQTEFTRGDWTYKYLNRRTGRDEYMDFSRSKDGTTTHPVKFLGEHRPYTHFSHYLIGGILFACIPLAVVIKRKHKQAK